ncbi:hypothetical protein, partial [Anaerococcus porci]|uniref:hypothetical protein n=1 Tax=Anaerococcus porci TaxID=2652269 RepID=UPI002A7D4CF4|nr:hypothetical protein [Anaerococcus porci]
LKKLIKENNIDINDKESLVMASDDIIKVARELNYMFRTGKEDFPSKIFHGLSLSGNGKNNNLDGSKKDTGKEETGKENLGEKPGTEEPGEKPENKTSKEIKSIRKLNNNEVSNPKTGVSSLSSILGLIATSSIVLFKSKRNR